MQRSWWGWGNVSDAVRGAERDALVARVRGLLPDADLTPHDPPDVASLHVPAPRVAPPASLAGLCTTDAEDRLAHARGQAYRDVARNLAGDLGEVPDLVVRPRSEQDIVDVLDWCARDGIAVVPFGGGTSVVGGVEPRLGDAYPGVVTLDLERLDRVLEVDRTSRAARIQAGVLGPALEEQLRPHELTLRHFPQSSGAGPSPDRLFLGSEGTLGVITEAWMRLQDRPRWRVQASVHFRDYGEAVAATRAVAQSGLYPANCRLLDPAEAFLNAATSTTGGVLVLAFESADHPVDPWLARAVELCKDHGGSVPSYEDEGPDAAGSWRSAFLRMPYQRDVMAQHAMIAETFETACTWDRFEQLHTAVTAAATEAIREVCGVGVVTCRFTHVYPDGPAPYFGVYAPGRWGSLVSQWDEIKAAVSDALIANGGTITHHHAVGRDHRPWYDRQRPGVFAAALTGAKRALDPAGILNPGVLIDPAGA